MNQLSGIFKYLLISLFFLSILSPLRAQIIPGLDDKPPVRERLFYGGNFGLQFGTYGYVEVSPIIGVWLLPRVAVAAGPTYKYLKDRFGSTDVWGGKSFTRFVLIQDLNNIFPVGTRLSFYLHAEYEYLSYRSDFFYSSYEEKRIGNHGLLGGFGISQYVGLKSSINFTILWVANEPELNVYDYPEFRIGVTF